MLSVVLLAKPRYVRHLERRKEVQTEQTKQWGTQERKKSKKNQLQLNTTYCNFDKSITQNRQVSANSFGCE